jgi:hypothetical protein
MSTQRGKSASIEKKSASFIVATEVVIPGPAQAQCLILTDRPNLTIKEILLFNCDYFKHL